MTQRVARHSAKERVFHVLQKRTVFGGSLGKTESISLNNLALLGKTQNSPTSWWNSEPGLTSNAIGTRHGWH